MTDLDRSYLFVLRIETKPYVNITRKILIIIKVLLIPVLLLIKIPFYWLFATLLAFVSIIEYRALKLVPSVGFSPDIVVFNGAVKKKIPWSQLENVILKDGLLTIDFKNNRLFQKEVDSQTDELEFNDWCSKKLYKLKG